MNIFRTWSFTWWEVGLLKVSLMSIGILLGLYFAEYIVGLTTLWWVLAVVPAAYFIVRMVREEMHAK